MKRQYDEEYFSGQIKESEGEDLIPQSNDVDEDLIPQSNDEQTRSDINLDNQDPPKGVAKCPVCGQIIYDKKQKCPKCGFDGYFGMDEKESKKIKLILFGIFMVVAVVLAIIIYN